MAHQRIYFVVLIIFTDIHAQTGLYILLIHVAVIR